MPMNEYGEHAEIIFNALGVCNRLNPAQLYELELNFIADNIVRKMKEEKTPKGKLSWILDFIGEVNKEQLQQLNIYLKSLSKDDLLAFIKETEEDGFYICQPPFWGNVSFDDLKRIYKKYDFIKPYKCTIGGKPIQRDLIFGNEYILKLKHEPSGKFSARSSAYINLKGVPSKSMSYKKNQDLYSNTPIRLN